MAFARAPLGLSSAAHVQVIDEIAPFIAPYAAPPASPMWPAMLFTLMMLPLPWLPSSARARRLGSTALGRVNGSQQNDGQHASRALAVSLEPRIHIAKRVAQVDLFRGFRVSCDDRVPCARKLDLCERLTLQVEPPIGDTIAPAVGGHDCEVVAVPDACERRRVQSSGPAPGCGNERDLAAVPDTAKSSSSDSMHRNVRPCESLGGGLDVELV
jgi:hypothetical protein